MKTEEKILKLIDEAVFETKVKNILNNINEKYESGDITENEQIFLMEYLNVVLEKKQKADYRIEKFKKKYNYDPKRKTVKTDIGEIKIDIRDINNKKHNSIPQPNTDVEMNKITMDRPSFNLKNSKSHDFLFNHEVGHINYNKKLNKNNNEYNRLLNQRNKLKIKIKNADYYDEDSIKEFKEEIQKIDNEINKLLNTYEKEYNDIIKKENIKTKHGKNAKEYISDKYAADHIKNGKKIGKITNKELIRLEAKKGKKSKDTIKELEVRTKILTKK